MPRKKRAGSEDSATSNKENEIVEKKDEIVEKKDDVEEIKEDDAKEDEKSVEQVMQLLTQQAQLKERRPCEESRKNADTKEHAFWDTQPVPKMSEDTSEVKQGPIDAIKPVSEVKQDEYSLPGTFEWYSCDLLDNNEVHELYTLLAENYVEDDDNMFRFEYSKEFLEWALKPPNFIRDWHLGVRVKTSKKLVAFISGIPATMNVKSKKIETAEINFLCVHKKLRSKRLAPVLIKEITRRVNLLNVWQAVYTAGVLLPKPIASCRYYHRSLNPKKLIDIGFSSLGSRMTMARTIKLYKVDDHPKSSDRIRKMQEKDVPGVTKLLNDYLKKFSLFPVLSQEEVRHWVLPRDKVVFGYVITNEHDKVTDLCSFYALPSQILGHDKYTSLNAAYSYWNVATTVTWDALMMDALIFARQQDFDVFNCLDIMDNSEFLNTLRFGQGDGYLQYYLYNWVTSEIKPNQVGLVLL